MRYIVFLLSGLLVLAAAPRPVAAQPEGAKIMARVVADLIESAGVKIRGEENQAIEIGDIVITVNMGDVMISGGDNGEHAGIVHRLLDMLSFSAPPLIVGEGHWPEPPLHGFPPPPVDGMDPEMLELMGSIPPDVDPAFVRFIFHVGELAWEHPEFRQRLERMVEEAHRRLEEQEREELRKGGRESKGDRPRRSGDRR